MILWVLIFILIILIDQLIKQIVLSNIGLENSVALINNFIYLSPIQNKGMTLAISQTTNRHFYAILSVVILGTFFYYLIKNKTTFTKLTITLISSGIIGNLIDFIFKGNVIDFIKITILGVEFPNFNIADIFIVASVLIFISHILNISKES